MTENILPSEIPNKDSFEIALTQYYDAKEKISNWEKDAHPKSLPNKIRRTITGIVNEFRQKLPEDIRLINERELAYRVVQAALKKRAGLYSLKRLEHSPRPGNTGFFYVFEWQDPATGEPFQAYDSIHQDYLEMIASNDQDAKLEVRPDNLPLLHLPKNFGIPITHAVKTNYYFPATLYHAEWRPNIPDTPTKLRIPKDLEITFQKDKSKVVPITTSEKVD